MPLDANDGLVVQLDGGRYCIVAERQQVPHSPARRPPIRVPCRPPRWRGQRRLSCGGVGGPVAHATRRLSDQAMAL
jgi:hypothetical protein